MELSEYLLEALREDDEFVLYRGEHSNQSGSPSVLLLAPASMQPALATLKKIEHEYSLRDELDSAWAVRSLALSEQRGRTYSTALRTPTAPLLGWLLLKDQRKPADSLPFEGDIHFDAVGDLDERNATVLP